MVNDAGLEDEVKKLNTMSLHVGAFVLSNSKRIMNNFVHANNGFYTNDLYYEDTDSMHIENQHWDQLNKAGLVGKKYYKVKMITKTVVFLWIVLRSEKKILFNYI